MADADLEANNDDDGGAGVVRLMFSEKSVRRKFIRKVYGILSLQLLITFGIVSPFIFVDAIKQVVEKHYTDIFFSVLFISIVILVILLCVEGIRRKSPYNYIFLLLFTICEGVLLGILVARFELWEIQVAVVATLAVSVSLTIFAFQTKIDFTMMSGTLLALMVVLFIFGIFAIIFQSQILFMLYSCAGALLFSIFLVHDTQTMMGGEHKYAISPEEYVFAALSLYLDVVNLFLMILFIIGGSRKT